MSGDDSVVDQYSDGTYLERNPSWHVDESPWKARQLLRILQRNDLSPKRICDIGCGAGEVLKQLQDAMPDDCDFWGFDVSPHALELSRPRANDRLHFERLGTLNDDIGYYDLVIAMDVVEHVEDFFAFLRQLRTKARHTILHVPLDLSAQTVLRRSGLLNVRDWYGHVHYFTKDTALRSVEDCGYTILDHFYTPRAVELPSRDLRRNLLKLPRNLLFAVNQDLAARTVGGYSLLILAS